MSPFTEPGESSPTFTHMLNALKARPVYIASQKRWIIEIPMDKIEVCPECESVSIVLNDRHATFSRKDKCWKLTPVGPPRKK